MLDLEARVEIGAAGEMLSHCIKLPLPRHHLRPAPYQAHRGLDSWPAVADIT
jgi:hypothetical protein